MLTIQLHIFAWLAFGTTFGLVCFFWGYKIGSRDKYKIYPEYRDDTTDPWEEM